MGSLGLTSATGGTALPGFGLEKWGVLVICTALPVGIKRDDVEHALCGHEESVAGFPRRDEHDSIFDGIREMNQPLQCLEGAHGCTGEQGYLLCAKVKTLSR